MLKILQARLQQYMNRELPDIQAVFRKGRDLTEAEDIKKRWQEYTGEFIQKRSSQPRQSQWCDHSPRARHPRM